MSKQPWISNAKNDLAFILSPPFIILLLIIVFQKDITLIEAKYATYTWLLLIVAIDVAHVYATLFKTYFKPKYFQQNKKLLLLVPTICFLVGLLLCTFGSHIFWSVLAYIAVFHFIRQQYGFMKLYSRNINEPKINKIFNAITIYTATLGPMIYWFIFQNKLKYNWFVPNEFLPIKWTNLWNVLQVIYFMIIGVYILKETIISLKTKYLNIPRNILILGTILSWYFGIIFYNNDLIFTALNVASHGIPYMALVYFKDVKEKQLEFNGKINFKSWPIIIVPYVIMILLFALGEEITWDALIWHEHNLYTKMPILKQSWQVIIIALLSVPQYTHYILDGIIWKTKHNNHLI